MSHEGPASGITGNSSIAGENYIDCDNVEDAQVRDGIVQGRVIRLEESVLEVQSSLGLTADGMLGPNTSLAIARQWGDVNDPNVRAQLSVEQQAAIETIIDQIGPGMFKQHRPEDVACVAEQDMDMNTILTPPPMDLDQSQHPEGGIAGINTPTHVSPVEVTPVDGGTSVDDVLGSQPGLAEVEAAVADGVLPGLNGGGQVIADVQMPTHVSPVDAHPGLDGGQNWGPVEMPNYEPDAGFDNWGPVEMPNYTPEIMPLPDLENFRIAPLPDLEDFRIAPLPDISDFQLPDWSEYQILPHIIEGDGFDNSGTPEYQTLPHIFEGGGFDNPGMPEYQTLPHIFDGAPVDDGFITQFAEAFSGHDATVSGNMGLAHEVADSGFNMNNLVAYIAEALNINVETPTADTSYTQSFTV